MSGLIPVYISFQVVMALAGYTACGQGDGHIVPRRQCMRPEWTSGIINL